MPISALILVLALQVLKTDPVPSLTDAQIASAYLDPAAREMLRLARERRGTVERSITAYRVLARERISVGLRSPRRDRVLFRQETAARIHWRSRGVGRVEVIGGRQVVPVAWAEPTVHDVGDGAAALAFDPGNDVILQNWGEDGFFRHPLAEGSEADYRFRSGDTTDIRLASGRSIRLLELQVIPRREESRLFAGSFWLDAGTHAPVRAALRLARPVDLERDLGEDAGEVPRVLRPMRGKLRYVTIDYGLWDQRWWLPRSIALDVSVQAGALLDLPVTFERSYTDYLVEAEPAPADEAAYVVDKGTASDSGVVRRCRDGSCWKYRVEVPVDTGALLRSEHLPSSIYAEGESVVTEAELRELARVLEVDAPGRSEWRRPELRWSYLQPSLLRYNRVEGLALGTRLEADLGPVTTDATLWLGAADLDPGMGLGVERERFASRQRLEVYRRLVAVDPDARALGLGRSLSALLLGRDDGDYFRAQGVELVGTPTAPRGWEYRWRLFAERQWAAPKSTDFSFPRLLGSGTTFHENLSASSADQLGASVALSLMRGSNPLDFRWGGELTASAQAGTFDFVRPSLSLFTGFPLTSGLVGALELAGGTAFGQVPVQSQWFLGGPATVRGYGGGSRLHGDTFWRGRAELGSSSPGARVIFFSDAGWAGPRAELEADPALLSTGIGVSLLDGLLRVDLARALRGASGWRLDLHLDAVL